MFSSEFRLQAVPIYRANARDWSAPVRAQQRDLSSRLIV